MVYTVCYYSIYLHPSKVFRLESEMGKYCHLAFGNFDLLTIKTESAQFNYDIPSFFAVYSRSLSLYLYPLLWGVSLHQIQVQLNPNRTEFPTGPPLFVCVYSQLFSEQRNPHAHLCAMRTTAHRHSG